jgi:hypothetical protein
MTNKPSRGPEAEKLAFSQSIYPHQIVQYLTQLQYDEHIYLFGAAEGARE